MSVTERDVPAHDAPVSLREMPAAAAARSSGRSRRRNWPSSATFKRGELAVDKGATILVGGHAQRASLHGAVGLGLPLQAADGRPPPDPQLLLPGDLIGLQGSLMGEMQHSVEALSPMLLCVFQRDQLPRALSQPSRASPSTSPGSPRARSGCSTRTCSASAAARHWSAPPISSPSSQPRATSVGLGEQASGRDPDHPAACRRHARPVARPHQQDDPQAGRPQAGALARPRLQRHRLRRADGAGWLGGSRGRPAAAGLD